MAENLLGQALLRVTCLLVTMVVTSFVCSDYPLLVVFCVYGLGAVAALFLVDASGLLWWLLVRITFSF
jgi:hypothetical protein